MDHTKMPEPAINDVHAEKVDLKVEENAHEAAERGHAATDQ